MDRVVNGLLMIDSRELNENSQNARQGAPFRLRMMSISNH